MSQQKEAQKAAYETKVIAVVLNSAKYNLLRTPYGLQWCLAKYLETPSRHFPIATLHDLVENVRLGRDDVEVLVSSDPNADDPVLDLEFSSLYKLEKSGFNIFNTGCWIVRIATETAALRA